MTFIILTYLLYMNRLFTNIIFGLPFLTEKLGMLKKRFAFLNPSWAALKYFDETQFLKMVQGESASSSALGRMPRRLTLPSNYASSLVSQTSSMSLNSTYRQPSISSTRSDRPRRPPPAPKQSRSYATYRPTTNTKHDKRDYHTWGSSAARNTSSFISTASSSGSSGSSSASLNNFLHNHFTYGAPPDLSFQPDIDEDIADDVEIISTKSAPSDNSKHRYRRSSLPSITSMQWDPPSTPTSKRSVRT